MLYVLPMATQQNTLFIMTVRAYRERNRLAGVFGDSHDFTARDRIWAFGCNRWGRETFARAVDFKFYGKPNLGKPDVWNLWGICG